MYLMACVAHIHTGPPLHPSGVNVETRDFKTDNYSVFVSWEEVQRADYYIYTITVNITSVNITMNSSAITTIPAISFEAMYNNFIEVSIEASNCAGSSETVTTDVYEGIYVLLHISTCCISKAIFYILPQLAVLLPVPLSMAVSVSSPVPG